MPDFSRRGPAQAIGAEDPSSGTRMESVKEIREAAKAQRSPTIREKGQAVETVAFRPILRPPMALLCVIDEANTAQFSVWHDRRISRFAVRRHQLR